MKVCICIPLVSRNLGISFVHKLIVFHWTTRCACYSRNVLLLFVKRKYVAHTMHRWGMSLEKKHAGQFFVSPLQTLWVICSFSGAPKKGVLRACILSWRLVWFFWKTGVGVLWRMVANPFRCAYSDWLQHVCLHILFWFTYFWCGKPCCLRTFFAGFVERWKTFSASFITRTLVLLFLFMNISLLY